MSLNGNDWQVSSYVWLTDLIATDLKINIDVLMSNNLQP